MRIAPFVLAAVLAGCFHDNPPAQQPVANSSPPPTTTAARPAPSKPRTEADHVMAMMESYRDRICSCAAHDKACAQVVVDDMTKWSQDMARNAASKKPDPLSQDDAQRMADVTKKMGECMMTAMVPDPSNNPCGGGGNPCSP